ncbi:MAG: hypothetical protein NTY65_03395 [Planctomycetota bacterium]|nr:hypothetical protein [Planctomycetota bacterium]
MVLLNNKEIECVKVVARWFSEGKGQQFMGPETYEALGITAEEFTPTILTLRQAGAVDNLGLDGHEVFSFRPTAYSVQIVRELDQQKATSSPPDIVDQIKQRARRKPVLAWAIIGALVLTMVLSILDNLTSLIERIAGWLVK